MQTFVRSFIRFMRRLRLGCVALAGLLGLSGVAQGHVESLPVERAALEARVADARKYLQDTQAAPAAEESRRQLAQWFNWNNWNNWPNWRNWGNWFNR